jgi:RNA polymerase sigma-70 factor (ECF subfamily)
VGTSDAEIVRRVRSGDTDAFAVLVARYRDRLGRYAMHMLGDREDAEEALQDSFFRAYRSLGRYRDDAAFGPWLFGILVNRCRTSGRRAARRHRTFVRDEVSLARAEAPVRAEPDDWDGTVRWALAQLAPLLREAFLLKFVEDMEYDAMSRLTGAGQSALKMRVKRAREQLRALLTEVQRV